MAKRKTQTTVSTVPSVASAAETVRSLFVQAAVQFIATAKGQAALNAEREGNYTLTVRAAATAETAAKFRDYWEAFKSDVTGNKDGIAVQIGCELGKPKKDGTPTGYLIPSGLKTAVSVVAAAMDYGIPVKDDKGLRSFNAIRKEKTDADAKARAAAMSPLESARQAVRDLAAAIAAGADALTLDEARECEKILSHVMALESGAAENKAMADARIKTAA